MTLTQTSLIERVQWDLKSLKKKPYAIFWADIVEAAREYVRIKPEYDANQETIKELVAAAQEFIDDYKHLTDDELRRAATPNWEISPAEAKAVLAFRAALAKATQADKKGVA